MTKLSIRNRLLATFLCLLTLTIAALGGYFLWYFQRYNINNLTAHLITSAKLTEQFVHEYLGGSYDRQQLDEKIKDSSHSTSLRITVITGDGIVLADSWENPAQMDNHSQRPEVQAALSGRKETATRYSSTLQQNSLYVALPVIAADGAIHGVVRVSSTLSDAEAGFSEIRSVIFSALFLTLLLAGLASLRLARQFTAPLEAMTLLSAEFGAGNLNRRLYLRSGDELEVLSNTLNNLAANLEEKLNELKNEQYKLELILSHMDNALLLFDRHGRITKANRKACEIFTLSETLLFQHNLSVIGNAQLDAAIRRAANENTAMHLDLKSGETDARKFFQVFLAPLESEQDGPAILAVFHDITALKEIQERQSEFINNASHELATPLTSIKGFAETLLGDDEIEPTLQHKFLRIIHDEADRMQRLVRDLLQLARLQPEEYRRQIAFQNIDLCRIIDETTLELASRLAAKGLDFKSDLQACGQTKVFGHSDYLKQVFINLFDNAIKYTPEGGSITLSCKNDGQQLRLTLHNSGIGIEAKHLALLTERFYRVEKSRSREAGGTGLGLSIVKFILDLHSGTLGFASRPGEGTSVTLTLPLADAKPCS